MTTDEWGIDDGYEDVHGRPHETSPETRKAILAAMGADSETPPGAEDAVRVVRPGQAASLGPGVLTLEDGTRLKLVDRLPEDLPLGYHRFRPRRGEAEILLISSPGECHMPPHPLWGWAVQLYAARSAESWGIGDFGDLRRLAEWSRTLDAGMLLVNPLHAASPVAPRQASPYCPSSRRFRDPLYLCIEEVPVANGSGIDLESLAAAGRALNAERYIDRSAAFELKRRALEAIWDRFPGDAEFDRYCDEQGRALEEFAAFCCLAEQHGGDWRRWPAEWRRADEATLRRAAERQSSRFAYHQWVQWLLDEQLARAAKAAPFVQDLPIGIDPGGADAWVWQDELAAGCAVGAPPDMYNTQGQDWGLPPFIPHKLRQAGYRPFIETIRATLRHAGGLRIDHVMGLFRLYWVPQGAGAKHGAFVRYRPEELLAIVALESRRAGALVVGEDLGTVEPGVRERLAEYGLLSYRVLWMEEGPPQDYPELAMVAVTTHDLPTIAGLESGRDLAAQKSLGLKPNEGATQKLRQRLGETIGLDEHAAKEDWIVGLYRHLAGAPSLVFSATLEDLLAVEERPNMPNTIDQWPNWSIGLPGGIEALEASPLAAAVAEIFNDATKRVARH